MRVLVAIAAVLVAAPAAVLVAAFAAVLVAAPAAATIVSGNVTGAPEVISLSWRAPFSPVASQGRFIKIDAVPARFAVGWDNFQDADVHGFDERQGVMLDRDLLFNVGGRAARGTRVSSHLIVFDAPSLMSATGSVTFSAPVLGILSSSGRLFRSDFLGLPGVAYQMPAARGIEQSTDAVGFSGRTVSFRFVTDSPGDSIRVVTAAVPEPGSWAMLIAGFGTIGALRRRQQRVLG